MTKAYYQKNRDRLIENAKRYYSSNKAKRKAQTNEYRRIHKSQFAIHRKKHNRKNVLRRYNITPENFELMLAAQGGLCAICRATNKDKPLFVDHNHTTKMVRGLLCTNCNTGIGMFMDNILLLKLAIEYLECHKEIFSVPSARG